MKKSLFALAALGAFAGVAQAQSSVTFYGNLDASVQMINNAGKDFTATTNTSSSYASDTPAMANATPSLVDGAIATSIWGFKGTEDLGGGMRAGFDAQSDLLVNNGTTHNSGLFRRSANVSIGGSFGDIYLGLKTSPMADASSANFAVGGNTVHQIRTVIGYNSTDFIKNGIQYQSPNFSGIQARLAYGMSDTVGDSTDGTILAGSLIYNNGPLRLTGAYNKMNAGNTAGAVATSYASGTLSATPGTFVSAANSGLYDQMGWILGAKYNIGQFTASYAFAHGEQTLRVISSGVASKSANANANIVSLGYQATPSLLLGANYIVTTVDSSLYNLQARYSLSKRTTVYVQGSMAKNGAGSWSDGTQYGNFLPVNTNSASTGTTGAIQNIGGMPALSNFAGGFPNTTASAVGVGIIHSF